MLNRSRHAKCYFEDCSEITPLPQFLASIDGIMNGYKIMLEHPTESPNRAILSNFALKRIDHIFYLPLAFFDFFLFFFQ